MKATFFQQLNEGKPLTFASRKLMKVSCLGDSITAGSFNVPHASSIWYPTHANHLLAQNPGITVTTGENLFVAEEAFLSSGASYSGNQFSLTSGPDNPRTYITIGKKESIPADDDLYLLKGELDSSLCAGAQLALVVFGLDENDEIVEASWQYAGGYDVDSHGYVEVNYVFSPRFIASLDSRVNRVGVGAVLEGDGQLKTGKVRNVRLYKLSAGIALHNQGVSYTTIAQGLSTIEKVLKWQPEVCIIAYGTNDIRNGVSLEDYFADLKKTVEILREHEIFSIISTLPPLGSDQINYDKVQDWNSAIIAKAQEWQCGLWDRWQAFDNGDLKFIEDGRHPTREGYLRLGEDVLRFFI